MELESRFSTEDIAAAVARVAGELSAAYADDTPLMVGVLTGSFVFLADLVRAMSVEVEIDFIRARSYGKGTVSSGAVEITKDIEHDVTDRSVVLVEDILDTGLTLDFVADRVRAGHPAEVKTCSLLVREGATPPDYMGLWIPKGFVVGYGIDYAERFRGLPDIKSVPGT